MPHMNVWMRVAHISGIEQMSSRDNLSYHVSFKAEYPAAPGNGVAAALNGAPGTARARIRQFALAISFFCPGAVWIWLTQTVKIMRLYTAYRLIRNRKSQCSCLSLPSPVCSSSRHSCSSPTGANLVRRAGSGGMFASTSTSITADPDAPSAGECNQTAADAHRVRAAVPPLASAS